MKHEYREFKAQFYRNNKLNFALAVLSALLTAALNLVIAWVLQQMIDTISGVPGAPGLPTLALFIAGILILIVALKALSYLSKPVFIQKAMEQYKNHAFQKLTQKSIAAFNTENTSDYISAFSNDTATIEKGYLETQFDIIANLITFTGALIMMLAYSPLLTVISCAFFILPLGVSFFTGNRAEKAEQKVSERNSTLTATLKDCLGGFSVMKSFQAESQITALLMKSNQAAELAKCEKRKLMTVIGTLAGVAGVTAQLGTFLAGAGLMLSGWHMTPGILIVFIDLTANVINPIQELPEQLASRKAAIALMEKLAASLQEHIRDEGVRIPNQLHQGIEVKDVSFGYEAGSGILHHITASFEPGKAYAIVGASGSGKSTLLNLLMASHGHYTGEIHYDGYEVGEISSVSLYDLVSIIQQNVFVFNASIRDNITMFHEFPKEDVIRAIELSGLSKLIAARGEGYLCGENGAGLSGGEKQRISIARSLLKKSQVLLADEATAALDARTAHQVLTSVLELDGMTRIVVTHHLDASLLKRFNSILTLKNGRIEETGTFDALMAQKGYFYSLFTVSQA